MCDNSKEPVQFLKFKITSDKLETPAISGELRVNFGVNLRLFRYGLVSSEVPEGFTYEGDSTEGLSPDKAPSVDDYKYCRKPLSDGYLYVYNENGKHKGMWYEYEVRDGDLTMIVWKGDKDVRQPAPGAKKIDCLKVTPESCISIAYSPFQWPARYTRELLTDEQRRQQRMNRIDVEEWFRCFSLPDTVNIDDASVVFTQSEDHKDSIAMNKALRDVRIDKRAHAKNWNLYITLHSPLDCAEDVCHDIKVQKDKLQQLITPSEQFKDQESDHFWLQTHACTFYQILYGKNRNEEKLKEFQKAAVPEEFLIKMLAVEERKAVKNKINKIRKSLLQFIDSDYYSMTMEELEQQTDDKRNHTDGLVINQHLALRVDPATIDSHMDVNTNPPEINNDIIDYLNRIKEDDSHPVSKYLYKSIDLDEVEDKEMCMMNSSGLLSLATVAQRMDNISAYTQSAVSTTRIEASTETTLKTSIPQKWLSKVQLSTTSRIKGEKVAMWIVDKQEINAILSALGRTRTEDFVGGLRRKGKKGKVGIPLVESEGIMVEGCITLNAGIDPKKSVLSKINPKLEKLFFSKPFLLLSGSIACFNLIGTINSKKDTELERSSVILNALVVASEISWFSCKYIEIYKGIEKAKHLGAYIGDFNLYLAIITSLIDAIKAFRRNDMDVCAASIGVAASLSVAIFFSKNYALNALGGMAVKTGIRATTLARINVILAIITAAILVYLISVYWQDTPLPAYFKNCILSVQARKKVSNWKSLTTEDLFDNILKRKDDIIQSEFATWRELKYSYEEFLLLTTTCEVIPEYNDIRYKLYLGTNIITYALTKITIKDYFSKLYFNTELELFFMIFYRLTPDSDIQSHKYTPDLTDDNLTFLDFWKEVSNNHIQIELGRIYKHINDEIHDAYQKKYFLCQRLVYEDGTKFPFDDKYIITKVRLKKSYAENGLASIVKLTEDVTNYDEYCNREDKTVLSLEELEKIVTEKGLI